MKKYLCLALLAFFGAAILSPVIASTSAGDGAAAEGKKAADGEHGKKKKKHKHAK